MTAISNIPNNPNEMPKFSPLDKVYKPKGYKFDSVIRSVFKTKAGKIRVVAENGEGLLHIFNESQLELCE